ncbi:hypothetical protein EJ05DRAFT_167020 [Pseudovirgaria hyperparasitica]|uniref:Zn(2)-C6 fungal-type domain-containing protein n=1 Tax=Pseudovirgaria hyperparasitica TaxID=470096 RepID=A0A6A6VWN6_9PEZI|nr:uncharacterized protein EJ05DRAFT_167020 [Pseudovirgaria hyperparasitica]KAF2753651.1 hypothetical protein EJ05DRAFT_167020 [Pseudovirgaria hyperparasitica]
MFTTFSIKNKTEDVAVRADQPRTKKKPVPLACEYCRKNRVKCDNAKPCRHCTSRKLNCVYLEHADVRVLVKQVQCLVGKVRHLEDRLEEEQQKTKALAVQQAYSQHDATSIHLRPATVSICSDDLASPTDEPSLRLDLSTNAYAAKIDTILSQQQVCVPLSVASITSGASFNISTHQFLPSPRLPLSRKLQDHYNRLYWRRLHQALPVLQADSYKAHYAMLWHSDGSRHISSLVDIVHALAVQSEYSSKVPDLSDQPGLLETDSAKDKARSLASSLFQSCSDVLNKEHDSPTWTTLQCYILQVHYLHNEWRHKSAYQVLGLAIRAAHILGLHQRAPQGTPTDDLNTQDRMRDLLFCLDTQQLIEYGMPCGLPDRTPKRYIPPPDPENRDFWFYYSSMMIIAKSIHNHLNTDLQPLASRPTTGTNSEIGFDALKRMEVALPKLCLVVEAWAESLPPKFQLTQANGETSLTMKPAMRIDPDVPVWHLRQYVLLDISYHWVCLTLVRWFLDPKSNVEPSEVQPFDQFAIRAAQHATAIVKILDVTNNETEALQGWLIAHRIVWDAALALIGFLHGRPGHSLTAEVISALTMSGTILETQGTRFAHAAFPVIREVLQNMEPQSSGSESLSAGSSTLSSSRDMAQSPPSLSYPDIDLGDIMNDAPHEIFDFPSVDFDLMPILGPAPLVLQDHRTRLESELLDYIT